MTQQLQPNTQIKTEEKSLMIIKQCIDAAVKAGVFPNMDAALQVGEAYNYIAKRLIDKIKDAQ